MNYLPMYKLGARETSCPFRKSYAARTPLKSMTFNDIQEHETGLASQAIAMYHCYIALKLAIRINSPGTGNDKSACRPCLGDSRCLSPGVSPV
jgi:hypothetical protein